MLGVPGDILQAERLEYHIEYQVDDNLEYGFCYLRFLTKKACLNYRFNVSIFLRRNNWLTISLKIETIYRGGNITLDNLIKN